MSPTTGDPVQRLADFFDPLPPERLGVAVSGGGDSVTLLCLLSDWSGAGGPALEAVTVDHGLRAEAAQEAEDVAAICAGLGIPHTILRWEGWDGTGNLSDRARRARYQLMSGWAAERGLPAVALGHTQDDVAEGFLMRLARGSGLDGLSEMAAQTEGTGGPLFVRPLLDWSREELRTELMRRGQSWVEDPGNEDDRFERARMRKALDVLKDLGIPAPRIAETARHLRAARDDLSHYVARAARGAVQFDAGDVLIPITGQGAEDEMPLVSMKESFRRVLQAGIMWISGAEYPPRREGLERLRMAVLSQSDTTLGGCRAVFRNGYLRLTREWKAVADMRVPVGEVWDGRWKLQGPAQKGYEIAALGEAGLPLCPDRKTTGRPAASLIASPAVWKGNTLIAAPLAGLENGWSAQLLRDEGYYFSKL